MTLKKKKTHTEKAYRSGLEADQGLILDDMGAAYRYEEVSVHYLDEPKKRKYTPDFILKKLDGSLMVIETKGWWQTADRQKHVAIKKQHPDLDIRFVFTNENNKIRKGSKTSYGDFCEKHGWLYSSKRIPQEWYDECDLTEACCVDDIGLDKTENVLEKIKKLYKEGLCK